MKANIEKVLLGDQLAGAKLIRMLEEGDPMGIEGLKALYAHTGNAFVLGITGAPGCGKSTSLKMIAGLEGRWTKRQEPSRFRRQNRSEPMRQCTRAIADDGKYVTSKHSRPTARSCSA